jgi:S-adenosylmethionine:tRNA ribosyltransferase-isomerase
MPRFATRLVPTAQKVAQFEYELPEHLIAQHPTDRRDESRLLVLHRDCGSLLHQTFRDLPELLAPGDLLVLNDTRVLPARLVGRCETTGQPWVGLFLNTNGDAWEMLTQNRNVPGPGTTYRTDTGLLLTFRGRTENRHWLMKPAEPGSVTDLLGRYGQMPLPPFIRDGHAVEEDEVRYQTVYAERTGSVAAPTAGLHFTPELFERLANQGVGAARVTLHIGLGTFALLKGDDPAQHVIHREWCEITQPTIDAIHAAKGRGNRVIAVGTSTTRTLETAARCGKLTAFRGETDLYILPPFEFRAIDGLITNFHLPRTTLPLLVAAFTGWERLHRVYQTAIAESYRFYSYGDALLVL